jgi:hypothetical protein
MRATRWLCWGLLPFLLLAVTAVPSSGEPAADKVTLQDIKYADLGKAIRDLKGKVVVVDFWGEF